MRIVLSKQAALVLAVIVSVATATYLAWSAGSVSNAAEPRKAVMYKPLQCGCCDDYAKYLERYGFEVEIKSLRSLTATKRMAGVPEGFEGCHTLLVAGYTVDGLVPIGTLEKLLTEKPAIKGITLPGMPWGAPGMQQRPKSSPLVIYALEEGAKTPRVYAQE
jgi:hypothetical protein